MLMRPKQRRRPIVALLGGRTNLKLIHPPFLLPSPMMQGKKHEATVGHCCRSHLNFKSKALHPDVAPIGQLSNSDQAAGMIVALSEPRPVMN